MQAVIVIFPGTNCNRDVTVALQKAGVRVLAHWHKDRDLPQGTDLIVIPGGFSFGDYLRCGAVGARSPAMAEVARHACRGTPVIGLCNGFQILTEAGLLPGALTLNTGLTYVCRDVFLRVETTDSVFTGEYAKGQVITIPIAHHSGNYVVDADTVSRLRDCGRIAFRYVNEDGSRGNGANPNGSVDDIAGIFNETRTVLGMMPHPERLIDGALGGVDGRPLFDGLVNALSASGA